MFVVLVVTVTDQVGLSDQVGEIPTRSSQMGDLPTWSDFNVQYHVQLGADSRMCFLRAVQG